MQVDPKIVDALLGPIGLTVFLLVAVWAFVTDKVVSSKRLADAIAAAKEALAIADGANDAFNRLASALEEYNRLNAALLRNEGPELTSLGAKLAAKRRSGS